MIRSELGTAKTDGKCSACQRDSRDEDYPVRVLTLAMVTIRLCDPCAREFADQAPQSTAQQEVARLTSIIANIARACADTGIGEGMQMYEWIRTLARSRNQERQRWRTMLNARADRLRKEAVEATHAGDLRSAQQLNTEALSLLAALRDEEDAAHGHDSIPAHDTNADCAALRKAVGDAKEALEYHAEWNEKVAASDKHFAEHARGWNSRAAQRYEESHRANAARAAAFRSLLSVFNGEAKVEPPIYGDTHGHPGCHGCQTCWANDPAMQAALEDPTLGPRDPAEDLERALMLTRISLAFGRVERVTRHEDGVRPETDTDHTVMLGIIACEVAPAGLDRTLVAAFALVHDLSEVYAGDTPTLGASAEVIAAKNDRENVARARLTDELGDGSWLAEMLSIYEQQRVPEARFVRVIDKVLPKLTHALNGCVASMKFVDRVGFVEAHARQLRDLQRQYPEFTDALELLRLSMLHAEKCWRDEGSSG